MALFEKIGEFAPDYLLASHECADVIAIPVEPSNGVIARGTVMYRKSTGKYAPAAAANCTAENPLVILNVEVDTTADTTACEDCGAYRAGHFVAGRVKLAAGAAVTPAIAQVLRLQGIVFDQAVELAPEFDN